MKRIWPSTLANLKPESRTVSFQPADDDCCTCQCPAARRIMISESLPRRGASARTEAIQRDAEVRQHLFPITQVIRLRGVATR